MQLFPVSLRYHYQKDSFMSQADMRQRGFTRISLSITCLLFQEMSFWMYSNCPLRIFQNRSDSCLALKGQFPCNMTKRNTPRLQRSVQMGTWSFFETISGAIQVGVPQKVSMVLGGTDSRLKPKSISLSCLFRLSRIFQALISRWTMFRWCRYLRVSAIVLKTCFAYGYWSRCWGLESRQLYRELAPPYYWIRKIQLVPSMASISLAMTGLLSFASMLISLSRFFILFGSSSLRFSQILMATFQLVRLLRPIFTTPQAPFPNYSQIWQFFNSSSPFIYKSTFRNLRCVLSTLIFQRWSRSYRFYLIYRCSFISFCYFCYIFLILSLLIQLGGNCCCMRLLISSWFWILALSSYRYRDYSLLLGFELPCLSRVTPNFIALLEWLLAFFLATTRFIILSSYSFCQSLLGVLRREVTSSPYFRFLTGSELSFALRARVFSNQRLLY